VHRSTRRDMLKVLAGMAGLSLLTACGQSQPAAKTAETKPAESKPAEAAKPTQAAAPAAQPAATKPAEAAKPADAATPAAQAPATVAATGSQVKIIHWGSFSANLAEAEKAMVERFNQSQKDVEVEYQFQGSYEELAQKLTAALQARQAPDTAILSDVWWFKFYLNKAIAPLDDFMKAGNVDRADFVDPFINEGTRKGQTVWIPFARSTPLFYYNKNLWQEAGLPDRGPETWDEFKSWTPKLLKKDASGNVTQSPYAHGGGASYIAWLFQGVVWQWGGSYSDPDFTIRIAEKPAIDAGEFWRSSIMEGWASTPANPDNDFRGGIAAAALFSTGGLAGHEANSKFPVGTAFLPKGPVGFGCSTGGSGLSVMSASPKEKQEAAFKYIAFATSTEQTAIWSQATGYMPVRKSAINGPMQAFYKEKPNYLTAAKQLELTRPQDAARVFIPNGDQITGKGLERIIVNKEPAEAPLKDVAATLTKDAEAVIRQVKAVEG
jgi:sn-glycerol 3-phosphate transport system substrate-binding protein